MRIEGVVALKEALDPYQDKYGYCNLRGWMQIRLMDAYWTHVRRQSGNSFDLRSLDLKEYPAEIKNALCYRERLTPEELGEICSILYDMNMRDFAAEVKEMLPGGYYVRIIGCDHLDEEIAFRVNVLPKLFAISLDEQKVDQIRLNTLSFMRRHGALALSQNRTGDISIKLYFDDEDKAVTAKLRI